MTHAKKTLVLFLCLTACGGKDDKEPAATAAPTLNSNSAKLTEAQVVGTLLTAMDAMAQVDSAAMTVIGAPGAFRFAEVMRVDHRAIAAEIKAVADTIKVAGQQSPVGDRLRTEANAIMTGLQDTTMRTTKFVEAQATLQRHLVGAMDSLLIPSSTTPALRQVLQDLRPAMVAHLQRAEQLKQIIAQALVASVPRTSAARISPDSARIPGDSTKPPVVRPPDTTKIKPDTTRT